MTDNEEDAIYAEVESYRKHCARTRCQEDVIITREDMAVFETVHSHEKGYFRKAIQAYSGIAWRGPRIRSWDKDKVKEVAIKLRAKEIAGNALTDGGEVYQPGELSAMQQAEREWNLEHHVLAKCNAICIQMGVYFDPDDDKLIEETLKLTDTKQIDERQSTRTRRRLQGS